MLMFYELIIHPQFRFGCDGAEFGEPHLRESAEEPLILREMLVEQDAFHCSHIGLSLAYSVPEEQDLRLRVIDVDDGQSILLVEVMYHSVQCYFCCHIVIAYFNLLPFLLLL